MLCGVNLMQANEESDDEATSVDSSARLSRTRMLRELAVALCKNEQRILFRLQYVSRPFFPFAKTIPFVGSQMLYDGDLLLRGLTFFCVLWLPQILRTDLRGLRTLPSTESMSGGAKGKTKRANAGLFNLFKWNIDILEK